MGNENEALTLLIFLWGHDYTEIEFLKICKNMAFMSYFVFITGAEKGLM